MKFFESNILLGLWVSWLIQYTGYGHHPQFVFLFVCFFISVAFSCIISRILQGDSLGEKHNLSERPYSSLQKQCGNGCHTSSADWRQMGPGIIWESWPPIVRCKASDLNPISLPAFLKQLSRNQLSNIVRTKFPLSKCLQGKKGRVIGGPCVDLCQWKVRWCAKQHRLLQCQSRKFIIWPKSFHHSCQALQWHRTPKCPQRCL